MVVVAVLFLLFLLFLLLVLMVVSPFVIAVFDMVVVRFVVGREWPIDAVTRSSTQCHGSIENFEKNDAAQYRHTNAQKGSNEEILHKLTGRLKFLVPSYRLRCK